MHLVNTVAALAALSPLTSGSIFSDGPQKPLRQSAAAIDIPRLGFGTWNLSPKRHNASAAVSYAIQTGYRHIDGAAAYSNEKDVGRGIKDGLKKAGLRREDIWVTSKLWNNRYALRDTSTALH